MKLFGRLEENNSPAVTEFGDVGKKTLLVTRSRESLSCLMPGARPGGGAARGPDAAATSECPGERSVWLLGARQRGAAESPNPTRKPQPTLLRPCFESSLQSLPVIIYLFF